MRWDKRRRRIFFFFFSFYAALKPGRGGAAAGVVVGACLRDLDDLLRLLRPPGDDDDNDAAAIVLFRSLPFLIFLLTATPVDTSLCRTVCGGCDLEISLCERYPPPRYPPWHRSIPQRGLPPGQQHFQSSPLWCYAVGPHEQRTLCSFFHS